MNGHKRMTAEEQAAYRRGYDRGFQKGVEEGRATQAILEIKGRERFLANLRTELSAAPTAPPKP